MSNNTNKLLQTIENSLLISTKVCSKCKKEKDLNEFRRSNSGARGRVCYCIPCQDKVSQEAYLRKKSKRLEQIKQWNAENSEKTYFYKSNYNKRNSKSNKC